MDDPVTAALFDFVEQWHRDVERGHRYGLEHYLERFPAHEEAIRAEFGLLTGEVVESRPSAPLERLGPYEIVRELGRGGQATVYLARDSRWERDVALKVLASTAFGAAARLRRFQREAEVLAGLSHPGLCDVFDADFAGDVPYIAMRYVPGPSLSVGEAGPPGDRTGLRHVMTTIASVGRALHVAHEAGIVHRDIKPGNILLDANRKPVIVDFGLAREVDDVGLTEPGAVFGTLHYMAPEQLGDDAAAIDRRTDVHALGVTLFELVTGDRPYSGSTREAMALSIRRDPPPDPRRLNANVPSDLGVVLQKALEKDPARRYATALEFAEDVQRVADYEPIVARRASAPIVVWRWAQRHPLLSTATIVTALLLTVGLIVSLFLLEQVRGERERYKAIFYATHARHLVDNDPTFALLTAVEAAKIGPSSAANSALYDALSVCREERRVTWAVRGDHVSIHAERRLGVCVADSGECEVGSLAAPDGPRWRPSFDVNSAVFHPDGERLVLVGKAGEVELRAAATGELLTHWSSVDPAYRVAEFSADGDRVLFLQGADALVVAETDTGRRLARFELAGAGWTTLRFLDRGRVVGAIHEDGTLYAFAVGEESPTPMWSREGRFHDFASSPDGKSLACEDALSVLWLDSRTGEELGRFDQERRPSAAVFDRDGRRLAIGSVGRLQLWELGRDEPVFDVPVHDEQVVLSVAFSSDGRRIATGSVDNSARVHDATTGECLLGLVNSEAHAQQVVFTPDDSRLLVSWGNQQFLSHHVRQTPGVKILRGHDGPVRFARFSHGGDRVLSGGQDGEARLWDRDGESSGPFASFDRPIVTGAWSPDDRTVLLQSTGGGVWVGSPDRGTGAELEVGPCRSAWFTSASGIVTLGLDGELRTWRRVDGPTADGRWVVEASHSTGISGRDVNVAAMSPDRRRIAIGLNRPEFLVVDFADGISVLPVSRPSSREDVRDPAMFSLEFTPDGRSLAVGSQDTFVYLYDLEPLRCRSSLQGSTPGCIAFDPDVGTMLVGGLFNPSVLVDRVDGESLQAVRSFREHKGRISAVEFHRDGDLFVSASYEGTVRLYRKSELAKHAELDGHTEAVTTASFSPDGALLLTASFDGTLRLWPTDPLATAQAILEREMNETERRDLALALSGG